MRKEVDLERIDMPDGSVCWMVGVKGEGRNSYYDKKEAIQAAAIIAGQLKKRGHFDLDRRM